MLFYIVAQPAAPFLLLKQLSGKVRLTGLRTTGSDGKERQTAESRKTDNERWESTVLERQQHVRKVKGRGRHGTSGRHQGARGRGERP